MVSMSIKRIIKRSIQVVAAKYGRHTRLKKEPQLLVLMYHRILPKLDPRAQFEEPGMMVTPETFKMHMSIVKQYFQVVHLSQWIKSKKNGEPLPAQSCAITFDDGWADNYQYAYPILKELELPATIFLVSDMIGTKKLFWPERVARLIVNITKNCPEKLSHPCLEWLKIGTNGSDFKAVLPDKEQLSEIINKLKIKKDSEIHNLIDIIEKELQLTDEMLPSLLNWQQVNEMCHSGLIEAGSHTRLHIRLTSKLDEDLKQEIIDSQSNIEKQLRKKIDSFCYPNGDYTPRAVELVNQHYECAVTTQKGWNTISTNNYLLNRIGLHQDISYDRTSFLARISGWL